MLRINTDIQFHVDTVIGMGAKLVTVYPESGFEDTAMLNILSQNNPDMLIPISDLLTDGDDRRVVDESVGAAWGKGRAQADQAGGG